jgi:WhiB family transcriptional regulator, redox-sensing transcriptional regulator
MHLADATGSPQEWRGGAACLNHDPELFFPEGTAGPALRQFDQAKQICRSCPVLAPCLGFALRHGVAFGIWGGTTAEERRQGAARLGAWHQEYHDRQSGRRRSGRLVSRRALLVDWGGVSDRPST